MISIECKNCNKILKVSDENIGKTGKCPRCGNEILVEKPSEKELNAFTVNKKGDEHSYLGQSALKTVIFLISVIAIFGWNGYTYLHNQKVERIDNFVKIYNTSSSLIQEDLLIIQNKAIEIENKSQKLISELDSLKLGKGTFTKTEERKLQQIQTEMKSLESQLNGSYDKVKNIYKEIDKLEHQACPLLEKSYQECIDFTLAYRNLIEGIETMDNKNIDIKTQEVISKISAFQSAAYKDGVEF